MRHLLAVLVLAGLAGGCAAAVEAPPREATPESPSTASLPGVLATDADLVFTAARTGDRTRVAAVDRASGLARASQTVAGRFELPKLTVSGMLGGLSHDGRTLVLAEEAPAVPGRTRFAVLETNLSGPPRFLDLDGEFSFDALSPRAERLFLIEHLPPAGSAHYRVRMLDLASGELDPAVIVDKRFPDERMEGYPLARAESDDGLWVYTLYRDGTRNFVHALLTDGAALCIDLPAAASPEGPWRLTAEPGGRTLAVTNLADRAGSTIDLGALTVSTA